MRWRWGREMGEGQQLHATRALLHSLTSERATLQLMTLCLCHTSTSPGLALPSLALLMPCGHPRRRLCRLRMRRAMTAQRHWRTVAAAASHRHRPHIIRTSATSITTTTTTTTTITVSNSNSNSNGFTTVGAAARRWLWSSWRSQTVCRCSCC